MDISKLSLDEKIGQMLCFAFHGTEVNDQLKVLVKDYKVGNIIHFARNIVNNKQVTKLNSDIQSLTNLPVFISLDQEGGMVRRVTSDISYLPGAMALASTSRKDIYETNYCAGLDLRNLGFNVNYAPVGDVNNNPLNPVINSRSYSDDPQVVSDCVIQAFKGFQDALLLPTIKHFPGHGDTNVDSHIGLPIVNKSKNELDKMELLPFVNAINNGIDGVMISHIMYTHLDNNLPSSLSYNIITKLLQEELGFKGLITTDSLTMAAIWERFTIEEIVMYGVNAGNDVLVFCGKALLADQIKIIETFKKLIKNKKISMAKVNASVSKILALKEKYCYNQVIGKHYNNKLSLDLVNESITKVKNDNLLPIKKEDSVLIIFPKISLASLVDNENNNYETLGKYLPFQEIIFDENFKDYINLMHIQAKYDKIIMATYNVKKDDYQHQLYNRLDKDKVIIIALRSPYDILVMGDVKTYICTYDCTKESLRALSSKLMTNDFTGKLPIKLYKE